jgi:hypothetical protein
MNKLILIVSALLLSACGTVPVQRNFPDVPAELMAPCPGLKITESTDKLSKVIEVVADNYAQYHECRVKTDLWIDWYTTQKKIFDTVK